MQKKILVIIGPTASGKSGAALNAAKARNGVVINADAMQLYAELRVLTARPTPEEEATVPHALYGVLPAAEPASAGKWVTLAQATIERAWAQGQLPILVGGTGLYLKRLMEGIAPVPDIPEPVRERVRGWQAAEGTQALHTALLARDAAMGARLKPNDTRRVMRALEVLEGTGRSLAEWQAEPVVPLYQAERFEMCHMELPRDELYRRCDARFLAMMAQGALEEVEQLLTLGLPPHTPLLGAVGVPELAGHLRGQWSRDVAVGKAQQATRNYAKRQLTWLRHQLPAA